MYRYVVYYVIFVCEQITKTMNKIKKNLESSPYARWGILVLVGFVLATNYYCYDAFSTLKDMLMKEFGFSNTDYGLFSAFYSVPNTFFAMAVFGGVILDKIGIRRTGFMFVAFMAIGATITAYGASEYYSAGGIGYGFMNSFLTGYSPELKMMLVGRFFFGLGAETSIVVVSKILVKWFKGNNLALAFGLKIGFARLGSFAALWVSPWLANDGETLTTAIWFSSILVTIGLLAFIVYMLFDIQYDKQIEANKSEESTEKDKFQFSDIWSLLTNRTYIYIAILCVTFYSAVFPFLQYAPDLIKDKFGMTAAASGQYTSVLPLVTLVFTPLFGVLIDRKGRSATVMIIGSILLALVHLTFAFTNINPAIPMVLLGAAFSLVPAAMWPSTVKLVKEKQIGTAYGLMYSIQNLGLFGFPLLAGYILDKTNPEGAETLNYTPTLLMFASLSIVGLIFSTLLKLDDMRGKCNIEQPLNKK